MVSFELGHSSGVLCYNLMVFHLVITGAMKIFPLASPIVLSILPGIMWKVGLLRQHNRCI